MPGRTPFPEGTTEFNGAGAVGEGDARGAAAVTGDLGTAAGLSLGSVLTSTFEGLSSTAFNSSERQRHVALEEGLDL